MFTYDGTFNNLILVVSIEAISLLRVARTTSKMDLSVGMKRIAARVFVSKLVRHAPL